MINYNHYLQVRTEFLNLFGQSLPERRIVMGRDVRHNIYGKQAVILGI